MTNLAVPAASPKTPSPSGERSYAVGLLAGAVLVGGALRLHLALTDDGIFWPDEVYQSLEPAHRLVFGYGLVAWEFIEGARNWALPGLVAGLLKVSQLLGLDRPGAYLALVKSFFALIGVATTLGVYRLGRAFGASSVAAAIGALGFALAAPAIYFAPRAMSETAATLPAVFGLALALAPGRKHTELIVGASLLGLAVLLRLQLGIFCVGLLAILLVRRQWREAGAALLTLLGWASVFGALDHFTWESAPGARFGGWFHSAVKYLQFNLVEDGAKGWGVSPPDFYLRHLYTSMPILALLVALLSLVAARRAPGLFLLAAVFLGLHSAVGHKELRFVFPALPLLFALAAVGLTTLPERWGRAAMPWAVLLAALLSAAGHRALTFGQLGQYPDRPQASAYDDFGPVNRMLLAAHDRPDLCGVRVDLAHLAWTGGHSYLHREVPLYHQGRPPLEAKTFNYVITSAQHGLPGETVATDERNPSVALVRLHGDQCRADLGYPWRLP